MRVSYNGIEFQEVRVRNLQWGADKDPSGTDNIYTKVQLEISCQWSPFATSSVPVGAFLQNGPGPFPNDSLGLSIRNLRKLLSEPRKTLKISSGGDSIWQCPVPVNGATLSTQPGQPQPSCDPGYGPIPEVVSLAEVVGDKLAAGVWRVTFWVLDSSNILLSNRWKVTAHVNDCGMTTRVIEGWTQCRADAIVSGSVRNVDDFRKWFFLPCPAGFRRTGCRVTVTETGERASWICTDVEDPNPLGADGAGIGAVKFEGEVTAGVISANKTKGQEILAAIEVLLFGPIAVVAQWPQNVANAWTKVTGGKNANKLALFKLAVAIAQDRLLNGSIVACVVTQGVGQSEANGRWVKVSCVFLPTFTAWVSQLGIPLGWSTVPANIPNVVSLANDISLGDFAPGRSLPGDTPTPANENNPNYKNFNLNGPNGNNARGDWVGALITQSIQYQGQVPAAPSSTQFVKDAALM